MIQFVHRGKLVQVNMDNADPDDPILTQDDAAHETGGALQAFRAGNRGEELMRILFPRKYTNDHDRKLDEYLTMQLVKQDMENEAEATLSGRAIHP